MREVDYIDALVQECSNSSTLAMELLQCSLVLSLCYKVVNIVNSCTRNDCSSHLSCHEIDFFNPFLNTFMPRQNGRNFADSISNGIFLVQIVIHVF